MVKLMCMWGAVLAACIVALAQGSRLEQVHLSFGDSPSEMTVSFVIVGASIDSSMSAEVAYGTKSGELTETVRAGTSTYTDGGWAGTLYNATLTGLAPSTEYYYACRVVARDHVDLAMLNPLVFDLTAEFSFRTAPPVGSAEGINPGEGLQIYAVADLGLGCDKPGCGNATVAALASLVANKKADFVLHAGDIAYTSGTQNIWDSYMNEIEPIASLTPYQVCVGNHESHYNFSGYLHRFNMPHYSQRGKLANLYHSYDFGIVHFLAFSTEHDHSPGTEQHSFILRDLQQAYSNRNQVPWIVVYAHKPLYCSTNDYYDCEIGGPTKIRPDVESLFKKYGVNLFLAGHLHNYERTYPVYNGTVVQRDYTNPTATTHAVIGHAGDDEGLTNTWESPTPDWSVSRVGDTLGYVRLNFKSKTLLHFDMISSTTREIVDSFTLTRSDE